MKFKGNNTIKAMNNLLNCLLLITIFLLSIYFSLKTLPTVVGNWDEGNGYYSALAVYWGQLPNLDFIYGYPGMMAKFCSFFYHIFSPGFFTGKYLMLILCGISALAIFYISFSIGLGIFISAIAFIFALWSGGLSWLVISPGYGSQSSMMIGILLLILSLIHFKNNIYCRLLIVLSFFLIGFSLTFKQNGVFFILAGIIFLFLIFPFKKDKTKFKTLLFLIATILPLVLFLLLRLKGKKYDLYLTAFLPWIGVVSLTGFYKFKNNNFQFFSSSFISILFLIMILASCLWVFIYPDISSIIYVINEIYFRIPKLIDRHYEPLSFRFPYGYFFVFLMGILIINKDALKRNVLLRYVIFALFLLILLVEYAKSTDYYTLFSLLDWDTYIMPSIILSIVSFYSIFSKKLIFSVVDMLLLIFASLSIASFYPYMPNYRYAFIGVFIGYVSPLFLLDKSQKEFLLNNLLFKAILFIVLISSVVSLNNKIIKFKSPPWLELNNLNLKVKASETPAQFLQLANYLSPVVSNKESIGGYPNFAFVFTLLKKRSFYKLYNFIGDHRDYLNIVNNIKNNLGPDYFLLAPDNYPYKSSFAYFPQPTELFLELKKRYKVIYTHKIGKRKLLAFKKQK